MEKQILFIYPNLPRQGELVVQGHGCKRTWKKIHLNYSSLLSLWPNVYLIQEMRISNSGLFSISPNPYFIPEIIISDKVVYFPSDFDSYLFLEIIISDKVVYFSWDDNIWLHHLPSFWILPFSKENNTSLSRLLHFDLNVTLSQRWEYLTKFSNTSLTSILNVLMIELSWITIFTTSLWSLMILWRGLTAEVSIILAPSSPASLAAMSIS